MRRDNAHATACDDSPTSRVYSTMTPSADSDAHGHIEPAGFAQSVDATILARARRGDMQAFAAVYARFGQPCYALALRLLGNVAQAEDLVQEVFLKLIETIRSYRGDAPFGAWLKRMTVNAAIDQLRGRRRVADVDPDAMFADIVSADVGPAVSLDASALLQRLPARARAIVVLHELEGYTHAEIAALFEQSESYSKSILARALRRLRAFVQTQREIIPT